MTSSSPHASSQHREPRSLRFAAGSLSLLAATLVLAFFSPRSLPAQGGAGAVDIDTVLRQFREAAATKNPILISNLVAKVRGVDDPRVCKELIQVALTSDDYDVERRAGAVLASVTSEASRETIYEHLDRFPDPRVKIVLCAVVARFARDADAPDPRAVTALAGRVLDPDKRVVFAALEWIRKLNTRRPIDTIIRRLTLEERRGGSRVYHELLRTLRHLTGQNLTAAADWKSYWSARKDGKEPKRSPGGRTAVLPQKFFNVNIESDRIVFLIDISGSMTEKDPPVPGSVAQAGDGKEGPRGRTSVDEPKEKEKKPGPVDPKDLPRDRERMYRVKQELIETVRELPQNIHFTIVSFNHLTSFFNERDPGLVPASPENKRRAVAWVRSLQPTGETWTDKAFERVFETIEDVDTVIFLSDGAPYRGGKAMEEDSVLEGIRVLNRFRKCRVHTIGFLQAGRNLRRFLSKLAKQNDGTYTELE